MAVLRGQLVRCYLPDMNGCQAVVLEVPGNREALQVMLDMMRVTSPDRELVADATFAILAITPSGLRVFRPVSVEELLRVLDVLCMDAAPGLLHVWMKASPDTEDRILAHMSSFPNQLAPARLQ